MKKTIWYEHLTPLFLAIFPILSLGFVNIEFIQFSSMFRPLLISVLVALAFYLIFFLILKNQRKSAILSGGLIFLLLTYGNAYIFMQERFGEGIGHGFLLGLFILGYVLFGTYLLLKVKDAKELNLAIVTGGLVIILYLLVSIGIFEYQVYKTADSQEQIREAFTPELNRENSSQLPDIYLILLDGHTRSDVLKKTYDFDNSRFINELENLDFAVANCAQSNYPGTNFSTKALFEMDYLHNIYSDFDNLVFPSLNNTFVFKTLNENSYQIITFQNFVFEHFNITNDLRYKKEDSQFGSITEFEKMVVDTSILLLMLDNKKYFPESWLRPFTENLYLTHYRDTVFALETLPDLPETDQLKFVYAHLLVTHDPFVFLPDGSFNPTVKISDQGYVDAVEFVDYELPIIVNEIIQESEVPPIIIIMGDHGAFIKGKSIEERLSILLAVYNQGRELEGFYEDITPVNLFRLIFNDLFDADYELLKDKSFEIWNSAELGDLHKQIFPPCNP